ncbi:hypothetical protein NUW58_g9749 [Xylaria curta]|uniref:Uncharacterized protein n=1 Tax=Xylaria curta TaxID=42375 RepID=A0ACC1MVP4_9PEZI|nr:hypothetical protein NUW58_g9749 [Xylaria curta]
MALLTWEEMRALNDRHPEAGITFMKAYDYFEAPEPAQTSLTAARAKEFGMKGFRFHAKDELPEGVQLGYEYDTWCLNPMVYCAFLLRRFAYRGGRIIKREIRDPLEVFEMKDLAPFDALINASGIGFGDHDIFITTGQTCLVANPCPATITRLNADGTLSFNVSRNFEGGTVIGGTKIPNDWNPNPSLELREKLLSNFAAMYPDILGPDGKFTVIRDIVGRRPTRKGAGIHELLLEDAPDLLKHELLDLTDVLQALLAALALSNLALNPDLLEQAPHPPLPPRLRRAIPTQASCLLSFVSRPRARPYCHDTQVISASVCLRLGAWAPAIRQMPT